ncbi:hypothetical protein [Paenibacillus daejeonensis]|uniref:hypothetical protein n=1 Tax=Paenibacillus daejeonensis TaxID=135193 RepID=UPI00037B2777|nr:hypothetical protein [Paenibacillus daejeonensis]
MTIAFFAKAGMHINDWVKVKLTDAGIEILRQQHEMLHHRLMQQTGRTSQPSNLRTDEDGYASFQLWDLMARFGPFIGLTKAEPFEGELIVLGASFIDDGVKRTIDTSPAAAERPRPPTYTAEPGTFHCSRCDRKTRNHRFCAERGCVEQSPRGWYHEDAGGTSKPSIVEWGCTVRAILDRLCRGPTGPSGGPGEVRVLATPKTV